MPPPIMRTGVTSISGTINMWGSDSYLTQEMCYATTYSWIVEEYE